MSLLPSLLPLPGCGGSLRYCCFKTAAFCCSKSQRCDAMEAFTGQQEDVQPAVRAAHLTAQSDGGLGESLPLSFKGLPLATELCPVELQTLPLFQKVGIGQFGRERRRQAVLGSPTAQLMLEEGGFWKPCMVESSPTCRSCCCNRTSCWLSLRSDSSLARSVWWSAPAPAWPAPPQMNRPR